MSENSSSVVSDPNVCLLENVDQPGVAKIKAEFILPLQTHPSQVSQEFSKHKRKRQRQATSHLSSGPKVCPFIIDTYPCKSPTNCPYIETGCRYSHDLLAAVQQKQPDVESDCPVLKLTGQCKAGSLCRWATSHRLELIPKDSSLTSLTSKCPNHLDPHLQSVLRKRDFDFSRSNDVTRQISDWFKSLPKKDIKGNSTHLGCVTDEDLIRLRTCEKKKIDFKNKLSLTPLTTLGNLPFRRICKRFGADITCGEMAVATNLLQGKRSEWALLRRHPCEDLFGVQLCGAHMDTMSRCADLIDQTCEVDFVDINCGCPIDCIYKKGSGSGLLRPDGRLESIVVGMNAVLRVPLTVKMRTGIQQGKNVSHLFIPGLKRAGVSLITIHGRSREQRYTGLADWNYIKQCVALADPIPVFGNGDVLSYEDYIQQKEKSSVSGIAIARGALIKPWIFTEIREARTWDISSSERLDILRDFVNFGLEQWGSDARGVENTRHFLLEWLSFLYRYIPYGILERVPVRINERPPAFIGRNDLETLMASSSCADWIKISELFLGPVPDGFTFTPKHKANAYS